MKRFSSQYKPGHQVKTTYCGMTENFLDSGLTPLSVFSCINCGCFFIWTQRVVFIVSVPRQNRRKSRMKIPIIIVRGKETL